MDGTDISIGVSAGNVHLEVTNAAQEVVRVQVPGYIDRFSTVTRDSDEDIFQVSKV